MEGNWLPVCLEMGHRQGDGLLFCQEMGSVEGNGLPVCLEMGHGH